MRRAWLFPVLIAAACGSDEYLTDGPVGAIDAPADAAHDDAMTADAMIADALIGDAEQIDGASDAAGPDAPVDATPPDAPPDAAPDAMPPDAAAPLPLLWTAGGNFGLVEASVAVTGFVRFDNNSGADVVLDAMTLTGDDYTVLGSTCTGTIPDQGWCRVDLQIVATAVGPRPGQVIVGGPAGIAHADLTATGGGRVNVVFAGAGNGTVTGYGLNCPGTCSAVMSTAGLQAFPGHISTFVGWDAPGCGTWTTCYFTPTVAPTTVTATFGVDPNARKLTIQLAGTGKGGIGVEIEGDLMQPCIGPSCEYWFLPGDDIRLKALATSVFVGWSGACTGPDLFCAITATTNTTATATFSPDPYERVTFLEPSLMAGSPAQETDADGNTFVTDGITLTAYDPSGAELWSTPVVGTSIARYGAGGTAPDYAGGSWIMNLSSSGETAQLSHLDAGGGLIEFFPSVGYYDASFVGDPSTGIPVVASTGHSTWQILKPGGPLIQDEDIGDFAADIQHGVLLDSTHAIVAARRKFDFGGYGAGGIARVRYSNTGTLLEYVTHAFYGNQGIWPTAIGVGPDSVVIYSGELWIAPNDYQPNAHYRWIQVLDYAP